MDTNILLQPNDMIIFPEEPRIEAGFTKRPDLSDIRRSAMAEEAGMTGGLVVRPCLVHGVHIEKITEEHKAFGPYLEFEETDGLITDVPGVTLTSTHGDCIPIWIIGEHGESPEEKSPDRLKKPVIGLAHAGWKGTMNGIAAELAAAMIREYGCQPEDLRAYIGPGIDKCCFQVSEDVKQAFAETIDWAGTYITSDAESGGMPGKYHIDLKGVNEAYLRHAGLSQIRISPFCTCCRADLFYSWRRDADKRRMLAFIRIDEPER